LQATLGTSVRGKGRERSEGRSRNLFNPSGVLLFQNSIQGQMFMALKLQGKEEACYQVLW